MDDLSFLMILSLISLNVSGISQIIQSSMLNFIYLDILHPGDWLIPWIFPEDDGINDYALNPQLGNNGFDSMILVKNLGSTFIYLQIIILLFPFSYLLRLLGNKCNK